MDKKKEEIRRNVINKRRTKINLNEKQKKKRTNKKEQIIKMFCDIQYYSHAGSDYPLDR